MQRITSTSPHKVQPHQKDTLNHKQKLLAKRAAAKVVRRKINESQQMSKSNINTTTLNQTSTEQQQQQYPKQVFSPQQTHTFSPPQQRSHNPSSYIQSTHTAASANTGSKLSSNQQSVTQSQNGPLPGANAQNLNHNGAAGTQGPKKLLSTQNQTQQQQLRRKNLEEEKVMPAPQNTQQPQRPLQSYETQPLENRNLTSKPKVSSQQPLAKINQESRPSDGEKTLNKRHQMRMTSGDNKKETPHNVTRSLIDEGSEDFTNIEEKLQEDTRISCRNAVASSLNNVSVIIRQVQQQQQRNAAANNLRNRRGTTQSNKSGGPSNQASKEETFETSSFFDEGIGSKHLISSLQPGGFMQSAGPHKCNQVDGYNIPTIFNTLMFGIDQSKVSDNIRESFSSISARGRTSSQIKQQQQKVPVQQQPDKNKEKLSQFVTKVEKSPILVFDQSQQKQPVKAQLSTRNQERIKNNSNHQKQNGQSKSPKSSQGKHSQLSIAVATNANHQQMEPIDTLTTEIQRQTDIEEQKNILNENEDENEAEASNLNGQEDFQSSELHRNHLIQTLQSLQYIKTLPPVNKNEIRKRQVTLPQPRLPHIKKTLIFDLDETLVHCIDDIENNPCDEVINVTFPNGDTVQAGINVRPYALECLKKANENYQVVVFTASHKAYADVVLDMLDPDRSLIQYRLYRDHCIRTEEGIYIKDLRIITNRQLKDLIIVDNAVYSFGYQLDNGIPIIPFYDDKSDEELMHLIFYFNCLATCPDVREQNRKAFQLKDLQEIDIQEYLQSMMGGQQQRGNNDQE